MTTRRHRALSRTFSLVLARAGPQPPIHHPDVRPLVTTGAKPASLLDAVARVNWAIPSRLRVRLARREDATGVAIDAREDEQNDARAIVRRPTTTATTTTTAGPRERRVRRTRRPFLAFVVVVGRSCARGDFSFLGV